MKRRVGGGQPRPGSDGREPVGPASGQNGSHCGFFVQFFRSTLLPAAIVLMFGLALFAVSARIWLPSDMAAPAPVG